MVLDFRSTSPQVSCGWKVIYHGDTIADLLWGDWNWLEVGHRRLWREYYPWLLLHPGSHGSASFPLPNPSVVFSALEPFNHGLKLWTKIKFSLSCGCWVFSLSNVKVTEMENWTIKAKIIIAYQLPTKNVKH